jgi:acyl-homoserine lactone acylase PvdQ
VPLVLIFVLTFPKYKGDISLQNINFNKIEIYRDDYAIPHIKSETLDDIFFGMGYAHA